jgi:hypothetical protein
LALYLQTHLCPLPSYLFQLKPQHTHTYIYTHIHMQIRAHKKTSIHTH